MSRVKKIKCVDARNDYVIIMMDLVEDGIIIDKATTSSKNEGFVIGVGPDASNTVKFGDFVVFRASTYPQIKVAECEMFSGRAIIAVRKLDIVLVASAKPYEIEQE